MVLIIQYRICIRFSIRYLIYEGLFPDSLGDGFIVSSHKKEILEMLRSIES